MITQQQLKEILNYDPETGLFTWLTDSSKGGFKAGRITNCVDAYGYGQINIKGHVYKSHRLAWLYMTGEFPDGQIDHINHQRNDNIWVNLRVVNNAINHRNRPMQHNNTSGFVGVSFDKKVNKFLAYIHISKGKRKNLGYFKEFEDAKAARIEANKQYGFSENHGIGFGISKKLKELK